MIAYGIVIATSLSLGFWAGRRAAIRTEVSSVSKLPVPSRAPKNSTTETKNADESDSESDYLSGDVYTIRVDLNEECKMVRHFLMNPFIAYLCRIRIIGLRCQV